MMNQEYWNFERVYLRFDPEVCNHLQKLDMEVLIEDFAEVVQRDENGVALTINEKLCRGRTIAFIVRETNRFVGSLGECQTDEDMKQVFSKRQMKKLVRTFRDGDKCCITGYALIVMHVMLKLMRKSNAEKSKIDYLEELVNEIVRAVRAYYREHEDDKIAFFLLECYKQLEKEIKDQTVEGTADDYPAIPRKEPDKVE